jgi:Uma2 family endonuclease
MPKMSAVSQQMLSPEQYLAREVGAEEKHEYFRGQTFAMAGATPNHSRIASAARYILTRELRPRGCEVFDSDLKVNLAHSQGYVYPDASVCCGEATFDTTGNILLNPCAVIEVLSPSTQSRDLGWKFDAYRAMPSIQDVVFIHQDEPRFTVYSREESGWLFHPYIHLEEVAFLPSLNVHVPLSELYANVRFPEKEPQVDVRGE